MSYQPYPQYNQQQYNQQQQQQQQAWQPQMSTSPQRVYPNDGSQYNPNDPNAQFQWRPQTIESFWAPWFSACCLSMFCGPLGLVFLCCHQTPVSRRATFAGCATSGIVIGIILLIIGAALQNNCKDGCKVASKYDLWGNYMGAYENDCECGIYMAAFGALGGIYLIFGIACLIVSLKYIWNERNAKKKAKQNQQRADANQMTQNRGYNDPNSVTINHAPTTSNYNPPVAVHVQPRPPEKAHLYNQPPVTTPVPPYVNDPSTPAPRDDDNPAAMSKEEVADWLERHQLESLKNTFMQNSVDGLAMMELTENNMVNMGVPMGRIRKFLNVRDAIAR